MNEFIKNGQVFVGCNYWASHAGIFMWQDWQPEVIEADFRLLSDHHINVLRIFPLWPDFQPLTMHYGGGNSETELRFYEDPLPFTEAGQAGLDPVMIERFKVFLDLAEKYGLKLIIGLITGWMSGRMFAPEAFHGKNLLKDPMVLKWQIKFVRYMVRHFKEHAAIAAWDLGNECNCMSPLENDNEAYVWAAAISMAIKVEDAEHPVLSGMHGLRAEGVWRMQDQGEFLDVLTTHPYPIFVEHCDTDPINRMKSALHAASESQMYADLSGIPCFAEEAGTLGPMICSEEIAADYVQASVFTVWAHNCGGFLWWCANEQSELWKTPYDWCAVERELGLFRADRSIKPVARLLRDFFEFTHRQSFDALPEQKDDAVCILTEGQESWAVAYGSFILAKQAGLKLRFVYQTQAIPEADVYFLPSLRGNTSIYRHVYKDLLGRVKNGAVLYISEDDALVSPFTDVTGLTVETREVRSAAETSEFFGRTMQFNVDALLHLKASGAEVLAESGDHEPFFTMNTYGKGKVYFLNAPIEKLTATEAGKVDGRQAEPYYLFYRALGLTDKHIASAEDPYLGLTIHEFNETEAVLLAVNYEPEARNMEIELKNGWYLKDYDSILKNADAKQEGLVLKLSMPKNAGMIIRVEKHM